MSDWLDSEEFENLLAGLDPLETNSDILELKAAIREHFEPKRKWTKITDDPKTMPSTSAHYLVYPPDGHCGCEPMQVWQFTTDLDCGVPPDLCNGGYWYDFFSSDCGPPIAWMPLPEPWGEG